VTNQEAFDRVWQWFIVEKHKPGYDGMSCVYYQNAETRCAIGLLLPKELAKEAKATINYIMYASLDYSDSQHVYQKIRMFLGGVNVKLLEALQGSHDAAAHSSDDFTVNLKHRLNAIKRKFGLGSFDEKRLIVEKLLQEISQPVLTH